MALKQFDQEVVRKIFVKMIENYLTASDVRAEIASAIAEVVADAPSSFDTLKEIADWIEANEVIIGDNTDDIDALARMIGTLPEGSSTVVAYIQAAVSEADDELSEKITSEVQKVNDRIDEILLSGGAGEVNVIDTVQQNGVDLEVVNKTVNVTTPTEMSELENDEGYIVGGFLDEAFYVGEDKGKYWYFEEEKSICFLDDLTYDEDTKSICYPEDADDFGYDEDTETIYFEGKDISADVVGYVSEFIDLDSGEIRKVYDTAAHESISALEDKVEEISGFDDGISERLEEAGLKYDSETETIYMTI